MSPLCQWAVVLKWSQNPWWLRVHHLSPLATICAPVRSIHHKTTFELTRTSPMSLPVSSPILFPSCPHYSRVTTAVSFVLTFSILLPVSLSFLERVSCLLWLSQCSWFYNPDVACSSVIFTNFTISHCVGRECVSINTHRHIIYPFCQRAFGGYFAILNRSILYQPRGSCVQEFSGM